MSNPLAELAPLVHSSPVSRAASLDSVQCDPKASGRAVGWHYHDESPDILATMRVPGMPAAKARVMSIALEDMFCDCTGARDDSCQGKGIICSRSD